MLYDEYFILVENTIHKLAEHVITTFVTCGIFVGICLFLLQTVILTALAFCILYYCNLRLHNVAIKDVTKLQRFRNLLAKVVTRCPLLLILSSF